MIPDYARFVAVCNSYTRSNPVGWIAQIGLWNPSSGAQGYLRRGDCWWEFDRLFYTSAPLDGDNVDRILESADCVCAKLNDALFVHALDDGELSVRVSQMMYEAMLEWRPSKT